jgi:hypothetical protein
VSLIEEEPNVARPEIELNRLILGQMLMRQFGYRIGRNALPNLETISSRGTAATQRCFPRTPGSETTIMGVPPSSFFAIT